MASNSARWESMKRRFLAAGLTVSRWEAATPETLGTYTYASYLNNGARGCAKSHCDLWHYQVEHQIPAMLVFEDDAVLRKDCVQKLADKLATINSDDSEWDLLLLNASEAVSPKESWVQTRDQCLTAGYVLSLRGASELVRLSQSVLYASDWMTQLLQRRGHTYTFFPMLVIQEEGVSQIQGAKNSADWAKVVRLLHAAEYDLSNYEF